MKQLITACTFQKYHTCFTYVTRALLLFSVGVLSACIGNTPVAYYSPSIYSLQQGMPLGSSLVTIARVDVPAAVSRPSLVLIDAKGAITVSSQHLWVDPLKDSVRLSLATELSKVPMQDAEQATVSIRFDAIHLYTDSESVFLSGEYHISKPGTAAPVQMAFGIAEDRFAAAKISNKISDQKVLRLVRSLHAALTILAKDIAQNSTKLNEA